MEDKPMGVNFFGWIRDGVKQSVLLELATRLNNWVRRLMQVKPALRCSLSCAMKHHHNGSRRPRRCQTVRRTIRQLAIASGSVAR